MTTTTQTRWLSTGEQRVWRAFLGACESMFSAIEAQLLRDSGLPHGYYEILVHLSEAPDRTLRMSELARVSTFSRSRLSHAVTKLEDRGWVVRRDCETDRRGQWAQLTDTGFEKLESAAPGHVEQVRRSLVDVLTPEQMAQLGVISEAIIAAARDARSGAGMTVESCAEAEAEDAGYAGAEAEDAGCSEPGGSG